MKRSTTYFLAILVALASALPAQALATAWQSKVDASVLQAAQSGKTDFIVYMNAKADLSPAAMLAGKVAKGTFVYEALTETARTSQAGVLSLLRGLNAPARVVLDQQRRGHQGRPRRHPGRRLAWRREGCLSRRQG